MSNLENEAEVVTKSKRLVLVGDSAFAEIAWELFSEQTEFEVVAFAVEEKFLGKKTLHGLPVLPVETLEEHYKPQDVWFFAAIVYTQMNRLRRRLYENLKHRGYRPASFVSKSATVASSASIGDHCFIFEDNTVQSFATIRENVILWSGNHIGHHSEIEEDVFISSHVVVSGFSVVGRRSFLGVNATISNNVKLGEDNWISPGVIILKSTPSDTLVRSPKPIILEDSATKFFGIE